MWEEFLLKYSSPLGPTAEVRGNSWGSAARSRAPAGSAVPLPHPASRQAPVTSRQRFQRPGHTSVELRPCWESLWGWALTSLRHSPEEAHTASASGALADPGVIPPRWLGLCREHGESSHT